ncbi:MAG: hypothetical protein AB1793_00650 [Candidatus Thermoplasmatota archaeon]
MRNPTPCVGPEEIGVLMDLLSHDMLNNNQATLSYLELIHSSKVDRRTREFAEKAASQVHTSSMLLDSIRRFVTSSRAGPLAARPVDLKAALAGVAREIPEMFPHKRVTVDASGLEAGTEVLGGQSVSDLFMNLIANLVQLDPGEEVRVQVRPCGRDRGAQGAVKVEVAAPTAALPQGVGDDIFAHARAEDLSKMSRVSGAVFAGSVARALGGSVSACAPGTKRGRGCVFEVTLKGAGRA